ncbi:MAG TPA: hypothetical protein VLW53_10845 [Candidatus Eisenbacteria bacterium]|nr:hypothetical protein [Candidatus Eisenbacteria bacterium]
MSVMLDAAGFVSISDADGVGVGVAAGRADGFPALDAGPPQAASRTPVATAAAQAAVRTPVMPAAMVARG